MYHSLFVYLITVPYQIMKIENRYGNCYGGQTIRFLDITHLFYVIKNYVHISQ